MTDRGKNIHARVMVLVQDTSSECALQMYEVSISHCALEVYKFQPNSFNSVQLTELAKYFI